MAFGTGTHETTILCLEAIEKLSLDDKVVFDIGSGSGILSIGARPGGDVEADSPDGDGAVRVGQGDVVELDHLIPPHERSEKVGRRRRGFLRPTGGSLVGELVLDLLDLVGDAGCQVTQTLLRLVDDLPKATLDTVGGTVLAQFLVAGGLADGLLDLADTFLDVVLDTHVLLLTF